MCLILDISEKVIDHPKSKDSNGDAERGREKKVFIYDENKNETVSWEDMPTEICPTDLKTCIHTKAE